MGMSASQARLLSITARLNDVEFKSQSIANTKIRLADESEQLAMKYTQALGQQKYQLTTYASGQAQKVDLTLASLSQLGSKYKLVTKDGKRVVTGSQYDYMQKQSTNTTKWVPNIYNNLKNNPSCYDGNKNKTWFLNFVKASTNGENILGEAAGEYACRMVSNGSCYTTAELKDKNVEYSEDDYNRYKAEFKSMAEISVVKDGDLIKSATITINAVSIDPSVQNDPAWLYNAIESGEFMLVDAETGKEVTASNTVALEQVTDNSEFAKAEAEYNAANMKINNKEKLLDNELKKLDTEHNALQTESDSIKNLIGKNIEKSFNLFS